MAKKIKIVLDTDVIIHFAKGEMLSMLPSIFPEYQFVVLDIVKSEIKRPLLTQLERQISVLGNITEVAFGDTPEERREYFRLISRAVGLGRGESACMVYCLYHHDVVGSSNLKDIKEYCKRNGIAYLTTCDFLWYAWKRGMMTEDEIRAFVDRVKSAESILPEDFDILHYSPNTPM
jgi:rRNA-processing protein FCF1